VLSVSFVPAAGRRGLTRFYDTVMATTMREQRWRPHLVKRATDLLPPAGTLIDIGAGTGTLAIAIASARPDASVLGVDADLEALALAEAKSGAEAVTWRQGLVGDMNLPAGAADVVVMSLVLHHLKRPSKLTALNEASRALRAGGSLLVADWGRPANPVSRPGFAALRLLDGRENTADHAAGRVPSLMDEAGFVDVRVERELATVWGGLELLEARRP
jgi:ubiquinone/menaquinone biosynthesis C-methylase UbiE